MLVSICGGQGLNPLTERGPIIIHCDNCYKPLVQTRSWQRFCDASCRKAWWWRVRAAAAEMNKVGSHLHRKEDADALHDRS